MGRGEGLVVSVHACSPTIRVRNPVNSTFLFCKKYKNINNRWWRKGHNVLHQKFFSREFSNVLTTATGHCATWRPWNSQISWQCGFASIHRLNSLRSNTYFETRVLFGSVPIAALWSEQVPRSMVRVSPSSLYGESYSIEKCLWLLPVSVERMPVGDQW